jgi:hypothetical protein
MKDFLSDDEMGEVVFEDEKGVRRKAYFSNQWEFVNTCLISKENKFEEIEWFGNESTLHHLGYKRI